MLASVVPALALTPRVLARRPGPAPTAGRSMSPLTALGVVTALIYVNQVLFTVYVLRVHDGDPSFVARYLPSGWFDLATHHPVLRSLARHFPAPELLAPSVLRVQAFLELPFVLTAFAAVVRWLDADLYRAIARSALLPLASVSCTLVFCVVEWDLRNPYTADDIAIRALSALVTPAFIAWTAARDRARARPVTALRLLVFIASLGALGVLVLVVYDTALLYNLGRLPERAEPGLTALAALAVLRWADARLPGRPRPGPAVDFVGHAVRGWPAFFLVPALAVRYGVTFGTPVAAAGAALLTMAAAALHAVRTVLRDPPGSRPGRPWWPAVQLGTAALVGAGAAYVVARQAVGSYYEAALLPAGVAFLVTAITVCAVTDMVAGRVPWVPQRPLGPAGAQAEGTRRHGSE